MLACSHAQPCGLLPPSAPSLDLETSLFTRLRTPAGLPAHSRKATGPGSMHRAAHSLGGDVRLSPAVSSAALSAATPPFLRPEHRSAVLLSPEGSGASTKGPQVLPAEGPAGPAAAWLLTEGLQQQLELPTVAEGQPICLWWRVTAGGSWRAHAARGGHGQFPTARCLHRCMLCDAGQAGPPSAAAWPS